MKKHSINFKELELVDKNIIMNEDFEDLIISENGFFTENNQTIWFKSGNIEIIVEYEICVSGSIDHDPGDYYNPSYTDVDINSVQIEIKSVQVDDIELELGKEIETILLNRIKQELDHIKKSD